MNKKNVGGKIITVSKNTEIITWESCELNKKVDRVVLSDFSIINEDDKDIYVRINGGSSSLLKPQEEFKIDESVSYVFSCIVSTDQAKVRWLAMIKI